ncbi:MAG TPA: type II toxin-antitoxin system RelE/ParE family toxin [Candidatus Dormibacteraeota bacterium]|nr:type II toxin-antitoxin system RelE/ParE family toxin [Candidatus Dormibacteraeota bacterium]
MVEGPQVAARKSYEVRLHPEAIKAYGRLRGSIADRIAAAIDGLTVDPRPAGAVKLAGRDDYRLRVGEYRIVYALDDRNKVIVIARIAHRRDVYRP